MVGRREKVLNTSRKEEVYRIGDKTYKASARINTTLGLEMRRLTEFAAVMLIMYKENDDFREQVDAAYDRTPRGNMQSTLFSMNLTHIAQKWLGSGWISENEWAKEQKRKTRKSADENGVTFLL